MVFGRNRMVFGRISGGVDVTTIEITFSLWANIDDGNKNVWY